MNEVDKAIGQVVQDTTEYRKTLGEKQAENEVTEQQVIEAIDSYSASLQDAIDVREQLPASNCVREINSRLRKLEKMNADTSTQKREELKQKFPHHFS